MTKFLKPSEVSEAGYYVRYMGGELSPRQVFLHPKGDLRYLSNGSFYKVAELDNGKNTL